MASSERELRHTRIAARYAAGDPVAQIAREEGVCVKTVRNVARRQGLPSRRPDVRSRNSRIARRYASGELIATIAEDEGVHPSYVGAVGKRAGVAPRRNWRRRYPVNEAAFDHPTPIGWWLIGLLAADGSVITDGSPVPNRITLCQRSADSDVLRKFLEYVGSPNRPLVELRLSPAAAARAWPRSPAKEARVYSKRMCEALARHGVVPNKTRSLVLSEEAAGQTAVWLGLLDGDGSVGLYRPTPRIDFFGTPKLMIQCSQFWRTTLNLQEGHPRPQRHRGGLAKVSLYATNAARAAQLMLEATPVSMNRKRRHLKRLIARMNERPKRNLRSRKGVSRWQVAT